MRSLVHILSLIAVLALSASFLTSAAPGDPGEPPVAAINKCCKPATPKAPSGGGCETDCLTPPIICALITEEGTWKKGECKTQEGASCTASTRDVPTPIFSCKSQSCTKGDGSSGKQCVWYVSAYNAEDTQSKIVCSGNPCS